MAQFKLIFDECLGEPVVEALRPFLEKSGVKLVAMSVVSYQRAGVKDIEWIPKIAKEGGWVVLSADRGKRNRVGELPHEKLPFLCRTHRVTHVLLSGSLQSSKTFIKGQALVAVWREILTAATAPAGTRFVLTKRSGGTGYSLVNADTKAIVIPPTIPDDPDPFKDPTDRARP
jgi:hypothetical protein